MLIISVFLVFVASSCSKSDTESDKEADQVSIYKLLLYPERYHKKRVKNDRVFTNMGLFRLYIHMRTIW